MLYAWQSVWLISILRCASSEPLQTLHSPPPAQHVQDCFGGSSPFQKALKQAFEAFINETVTDPTNQQPLATASELLASFCDHLLRKVCT